MKFKRFLALVLSMLTLLVIFTACGNKEEYSPLVETAILDTKDNGEFAYDVHEEYMEIVEYLGKETTVKIPSMIDEKPVKAICDMAFKDNKNIIEVILPDTMVKIGYESFSGCEKLENVELNLGLYTISDNAFYGSTAIKEIAIPESVEEIGSFAFSDCTALEKVTIPSTVSNIGGGAFLYTKWLDGLTDEFVVVGDGVLVSYNGEKVDVTIPDGVKQVSGFCNEFTVVTVKFPESVESIGNMGFAYCNSIKEISLHKNIKTINDKAFLWCQKLEKITLPEKLVTIGDEVFSDCSVLKEVTFPESVKTIGSRVFLRCVSFKKATFMCNVFDIGNDMFADAGKDPIIAAYDESEGFFYAERQGYKFEALK